MYEIFTARSEEEKEKEVEGGWSASPQTRLDGKRNVHVGAAQR